MLRSRELVFAGVAAVLLVLYLGIGVRVGPAFMPPSSPTPTPSKPVSLVPIGPNVTVNGTDLAKEIDRIVAAVEAAS